MKKQTAPSHSGVFPPEVKKALDVYAFNLYVRQGLNKLSGAWYEVVEQEIVDWDEAEGNEYHATIKWGLQEIGHNEEWYIDVIYQKGKIEEIS